MGQEAERGGRAPLPHTRLPHDGLPWPGKPRSLEPVAAQAAGRSLSPLLPNTAQLGGWHPGGQGIYSPLDAGSKALLSASGWRWGGPPSPGEGGCTNEGAGAEDSGDDRPHSHLHQTGGPLSRELPPAVPAESPVESRARAGTRRSSAKVALLGSGSTHSWPRSGDILIAFP